MIIDKLNEFSDEQAVTATALSENVVDLGASGTIEGKPFYLVIKCMEDATAAGAATVTFTLETDDAEAIDSSIVLHTTAAIGKASLTAGSEVVRIAINGFDLQQYLAVRYTVATGPLTAGKFSAFLTADADTNV